LDLLGFLWSNLDLSMGYSENMRKNPPPAKLAYQVACNGFRAHSAPSDPSMVNWSSQKEVNHVSGFVNELGCGLVLGDQIRMSREACVAS
jgi:hypothetical protein